MHETSQDEALRAQIVDAMYGQDYEALDRLAPCGCCCDEHYSLDCPAHLWMGCRGSYAVDRPERVAEEAAWKPKW